ncbi:aminotransferase in exopolysaccharide biosynthesis [Rhodovulum bhavnagarense]|uniref:Aminotransferase in exopolysaccharide biosynthesis n=1 Tax=Rhodovulum bhavnagarense TaxID=992286 RepID=A0A4R2R6T0_9RHOB|nr:LegC family aminotransferase [Rhodovulum bhavnagarense]TCP58780.1 aminotransferase in exopolysaccharide biosynthesis [Rhodovulum bhavnagarense]
MLENARPPEALAEALIGFVRFLYETDEFIPLHVPTLGEAEAQAVAEAVRSGMISTVGPQVAAFEEKLAEITGARHVVATVNGTAALHLALLGGGVQPGDEVITQALTFVATGNAIRYCGAEPVFLDVDRNGLGLSVDSVELFLEEHALREKGGGVINRQTGRPIRACLPMHTNGHPGDMARMSQICERWGLALVEDAAEALGSFRDGLHAGRVGQCGILSFNGNKIISTGQGGAVITDDAAIAARIRHLAAVAKRNHPWRYEHDAVGYNYRLPGLNAALGLVQLDRLPAFLESKRAIAAVYTDWFEEHDLPSVREPAGARSNFWFNAFLVDSIETRDAVLEWTNARGVMTRPLWDPLNTLPPYRDCQTDDLSNTKWLFERLINVPSTPRLK